MSNTSNTKTANKKTTKKTDDDTVRVIVGEIGRDTKTGILGRGYSYDNGKTFHVTDTMYGRLYGTDDIDAIWISGTADKVKQEVNSATAEIPNIESTANEAVSRADSAIAASKVNSDAQIAINSGIAAAYSSINTVKTNLESVSSNLEKYAKSAAAQGHDITVIKQKQGQFEIDYAGTKGDVNQIKASVKGLSENLKDSEKNVASLQVTAKKLQASMSDAQGNVSNLQLTAKKYERTFEDQSGRLSKVEQTANGTQQTVSNQQGQISNLQSSIDGIQGNVSDLKSDTSSKITQLSNTFQSKIGPAQIAINDLKNKTLWKSTDSVDLNSAVSQQKIFVKGGSNLPPGGYWWYVQVEPGYDSRAVQYAVSDRDNKQYRRQYDGANWSAWSQDASESEITQLRDDINLRVKKGDLLSQINIDAGHTLIQSNKIYLAAGNVVFSDNAFIPSAAIENLDASKLTFYGPYNTYATIGSSVKQYDDDKLKNTINLQYNGGIELHSSYQQGSILTMHDQNIRLAVKSNGMAETGEPADQYSGMYVSPGYTLLNSYQSDGTTSGIAIGSGDSGINKDYRIVIYDGSKSNDNLSEGVQVTGYRFDTSVGSSNIRSRDWIAVRGDNEAWLEGGNQQIHMNNGEIVANNMSGNSTTGVHLIVHGWASYDGFVEAMGWTTKSTLSSKTRIQPLDTAKALATVNATDLTTFQYKAEVAEGMTKRHAGPVIDDVHDVAQYSTPDAFVAENRQGRSDADIVGYLMGAVQELSKQLNEVKEKIKL